MSDESLHPGEEAIKATPPGGSKSEDEFAELFSEIGDAPEGESLEDAVKRQGEIIARMQKGIAKAFSKGVAKKEEPERKETPAQKQEDAGSSDLEALFFEQRPEAELVSDDLKKVAKAQGISVLQAWRNESWLQEKAKALSASKSEEEKNRGKVGEPSGAVGTAGLKFGEIDLENKEHVKWLRSKPGRLSEYSTWFAEHGK